MENQDEAFAPLAGSKNALAEYKNPFGFSLQVIQSAVDMMLALGGVPAAEVCIVRHSSARSLIRFIAQSATVG